MLGNLPTNEEETGSNSDVVLHKDTENDTDGTCELQ